MLLSEVDNNVIVRVVEINTNEKAKQRLLALGLHINDVIQIISNSNFSPILIKNITKNDARIAIGRGIAQKIEVEQVV
ncbi:MAG: ferrous iron transport protein A [Ignavibacteria bacterium]|nr:ferrous iron transport protein A [Ignavibacteria bacterium]